MEPIVIEIYTGLTLSYSLQRKDEYRDAFYEILRFFLETEKKELSDKDVFEMTKQKMIDNITGFSTVINKIPIEMIKEILHELHYYSILSRVYSPENDVKYVFR